MDAFTERVSDVYRVDAFIERVSDVYRASMELMLGCGILPPRGDCENVPPRTQGSVCSGVW